MGEYLLNAFATLFVTIEPIGLAPIFLGITAGQTEPVRHRIAILASIIAASVLIGFALVGAPVIEFLGISLPAFRVAGGLLLFWIAFEMIFDVRAERKERVIATASPADTAAAAAFPLAVPMMAGPAAIAATILTAGAAPNTGGLALLILLIIGIVGMCLVVFLLASRFERFLKKTSRIIIARLFGVLLAALAVQFIADGIKAIIAEV